MTPIDKGQIVKFHTPLEGENSEQLYVVLDLYNSNNTQKAKIQALNTGLPFPPISMVKASDLIIIPVSTADLLGHITFVIKEDGSKVLGKILTVEHNEVLPSLVLKDNIVETNVNVSISDKEGTIHYGKLVVI